MANFQFNFADKIRLWIVCWECKISYEDAREKCPRPSSTAAATKNF